MSIITGKPQHVRTETEEGTTETLRALSAPEEEGPPFENPDGCRAIVAVGEGGEYVFLEKPNLWFFSVEPRPQDNGFGEDFDLAPGVYEMTFGYRESQCLESGHVDDWEMTMTTCAPLWAPPLRPTN
jgi:hypothetical protein